jgi:hypothetical protein
VVQGHLTTCLTASCTYSDISNYQTWAIDTCVDVTLASMSASLSSMTVQYLATAAPGSSLTTTRRNNPTATVTTRPTTDTNNEPKSKSISIGIIIGAVVGGILLLGFLCMAVIFCLWRRSKSKANNIKFNHLSPNNRKYSTLYSTRSLKCNKNPEFRARHRQFPSHRIRGRY